MRGRVRSGCAWSGASDVQGMGRAGTQVFMRGTSRMRVKDSRWFQGGSHQTPSETVTVCHQIHMMTDAAGPLPCQVLTHPFPTPTRALSNRIRCHWETCMWLCSSWSRTLFLAFVLTACASPPSKPGGTPSLPLPSSPQILMEGQERSDKEWELVRQRAEAALPRLMELFPGAEEQLPLRIRLGGEGGPGRFPNVDPDNGTIVLYRYPGPGGSYEASLVHEMVHALRRPFWSVPTRQTDLMLFLEEGITELSAEHVGFASTGFPLYGFPVAVSVGHWIDQELAISPATLARRHRELNFRCMPQAYSIRLSFMHFLVGRVGLPALIALASRALPINEQEFSRFFGAALDELADQWREWARAQWQQTPNAQEQARAWRQMAGITALPVCDRDIGNSPMSPPQD